ncbi:MAG: DnaD domain protein [Christensenellaceae bacterium]|jgi:DnaD/phage-associated family protein|nr:DnaD domain protein [Christensenellaceae bacterium]
MAFCKFSPGYIHGASVNIDVAFIHDYVPTASGDCIRVYLFGLLKALSSETADNTLENFSKNLGLSTDDVESCFRYWQDQGLVQVIDINPIEVRFLSVTNAIGTGKKYNANKYAGFNLKAQELLSGRMITLNEYNEYYTLIETKGIEPEALLMIIAYCIKTKGPDIGYNYILTVTNHWIREGIKNAAAVEKRLGTLENYFEKAAEVATALKSKAEIGIEEKQLYHKWTKEMGFDFGVVLFVAKTIAKQNISRFKFEKLDNQLNKYYELKLMSIKEIEEYEANKQTLSKLTIKIIKALGLYYESIDTIIETYTINWIHKGFAEEVLEKIANLCFKQNIRTLSGMDSVINKFAKLGVITLPALSQYIEQTSTGDNKIKQILEHLGIMRNVNHFDRENYKTWISTFGFGDELIDYAVNLAAGKNMQYLNQVLTNFYHNKISTVDQAKKQQPMSSTKPVPSAKTALTRSYSDEEINAVFANLDDIDW